MEYEYLFADRKRIGDNIVALMKDRRCTKVKLSQEMKMSRPTLDAFLRGEINNATKYDEYIDRLLAYMQINDSVLNHYKELPSNKKSHRIDENIDTMKNLLVGKRVPMLSGDDKDILNRVSEMADELEKLFAVSYSVKNIQAINKALKTIEDKEVRENETKQAIYFGVCDVKDKEEVAFAIEAGARFVVSSVVDPEIANICKVRDVLCIMNVMTISEAIHASNLGCDVVGVYATSDTEFMVKELKYVLDEFTVAIVGGEKEQENRIVLYREK